MDSHRQQSSSGLSPTYIWVLRIVVGCTVIMVLMSSIMSFVRGASNPMFILLGVNVIVSGLIAGWSSWCYQSGHMSLNTHWFLLLVGLVVIWQCIATNIYVFNLPLRQSFVNMTDVTNSTADVTGYVTDWTTMTITTTTTKLDTTPDV
jgi:hypothetical protein